MLHARAADWRSELRRRTSMHQTLAAPGCQVEVTLITPDMHHETFDPLKTEPGFVLSVPWRHRHGVAWCENGALTDLLRRCDAHAMMHGASRVIARRERRRQKGGKRSFERFYCDPPQKNPENPRSAPLNAFPRVSHLSGNS